MLKLILGPGPAYKEESLTDPEFLRDLMEKLGTVAPNIIGTDDYHIDRLRLIANELEGYQAEAARFSEDAAKLTEKADV